MSGSSPPPSGIMLGASEFREMRRPGVRYVDKTEFVAGVLESLDKVLLFPRPRRFGKTLNLSTLRCFVEKSDEDVRPLFAGLAIEQSAEAWAHFQRHPVIYLTFKDVKAMAFDRALDAIRREIASAYNDHIYLLDRGALRDHEKKDFLQILDKEGDIGLYARALLDLSAHLHRYHGEQVAILVDEYDTPIHSGFSSGYYDAIVEFCRSFLSAGLKDNPHLWKGVLTGILRVAKESIFSGLNNLAVYGILHPAFSTSFGFTPGEVARLAHDVGREDALPSMERWYNGYRFGGEVIYNPWSVLSFLKDADTKPGAYWISTSSNDLVRDLLLSHGDDDGDLETLLRGKSITKSVSEHVSLRDLSSGTDTVWALLLFTGYLTATSARRKGALVKVRLRIPNREVRDTFRLVFKTWLQKAIGDGGGVRKLARALFDGDVMGAEELLGKLVLSSLSMHDTGSGPGEPERVYHAFVLGLLVWLGPRYRVWSNRESGYGRCDVMILPKVSGETGVVMELKALRKGRKETAGKAMAAALRQLADKGYAAELREMGAGEVREIGVVFDGKRVKVGMAWQARRGGRGGGGR